VPRENEVISGHSSRAQMRKYVPSRAIKSVEEETRGVQQRKF